MSDHSDPHFDAPPSSVTTPRRRKLLSNGLRIVVAILGLGFIFWSIDWQDKLLIPAGVELPGGRVVDSPTKLPLVSSYEALREAWSDPGKLEARVSIPRFSPSIEPTEPSPEAGHARPETDAKPPGGDPDHPPPEAADEAAEEVGPERPGEQVKGEPEARVVTLTIPEDRRGLGEGDFQLTPGLLTMLGDARHGLLLLGLLLVGLVPPAQAMRWLLLLRARGMPVTAAKAFALTMVGLFFNFCMPGTTGGDLVRAYYAARGSGRKTETVMTIVIDRVLGLFGLLVLAAVCTLFMLEHPLVQKLALSIWTGAAVLGLLTAAYLNPSVRRALRFEPLLKKVPFQDLFRRIDEAAVAYREHRGALAIALLISVAVHFLLCSAAALAGFSLGMNVPFGLLLVVLPVMFLAGSMPISFQGLGVMEALAVLFILEPPHATANQIVGMLLLFRLFMLAYGLLGSLFLLRGDIHLHPQGERPTPGEGESEPVAQG